MATETNVTHPVQNYNILISMQDVSYSACKPGELYTAMNGEAFMKYKGKDLYKPTDKVRCDDYIPFKVKNVSYHKKMYQPCELEVVGLVAYKKIKDPQNNAKEKNELAATLIADYKNYFIQNTLTIFEDKNADNGNSFLESTTKYIIYSLSARQDPTNTNELYITLKACSPDKQLDLKPYCETYYNKALVGDVLKGNLGANGIFNGKVSLDDTTTFLNIGYGTDKKADFKQPYLVQYNETFYQFLARTANRCGEYLYFENGKLVLGSKKDKAIGINNFSNAIIEFPIEDSYGAGADAFGDTGVNPTIIQRSYTESNAELSDSAKRGYFDEVYDNNNNYKIIDDDNYQGQRDVITDGIATVGALGGIFQTSCLSDAIATAAKKTADLGIRGAITSELKSDFDNAENSKAKHNKTLETNGEKFCFKSDWYANILNGQKAQDGKRLIIKLSKQPNSVLLGDKLEMQKDDEYIITEVSGKWYMGTRSVVVKDEETNIPSALNEHSIYAIKNGVTPYLGMENRTRKSSAQLAIVADNKDPLRMGRIRIRYPWDLKTNMSPWIRVCTQAAYKEGGIVCTPAVDDEVMVDYENGNMEKPYAIGFVHTKTNRPYLGDRTWLNKAKSYKISQDPGTFCLTNRSGQSITLANGGSAAAFTAGMLPGIAGTWVRGFSKFGDKKLGGKIVLTDAYGITTIKQDTGNRCITIDSALGKVKISAFDGISISAPNGDIKLSGKNITLEAGNNVTINSGGNKGWVGGGNAAEGFGSGLTKSVLGTVDTWSQWGMGSSLVSGIFDISYLRAVVEVFLRPLDGTTKIQTPGYINFVTGDGKSIYKKDKFFWNDTIKEWQDERENPKHPTLARFGAGVLSAIAGTTGANSIEGMCQDLAEYGEITVNGTTGNPALESDKNKWSGVYVNTDQINAAVVNNVQPHAGKKRKVLRKKHK